MKYDSRVYRTAANTISTKSCSLMGTHIFACGAISRYSDSENRERNIKFFSRFFKPRRYLQNIGWWSNYSNCTKESQLARQLALDLMAEMIEQGDI